MFPAPRPPRSLTVTDHDARVIALACMEHSGLTAEQMWIELRRWSGHRPSRRRCRATWSDVHEWLSHLIIEAVEQAEAEAAPCWVVIGMSVRRAQ